MPRFEPLTARFRPRTSQRAQLADAGSMTWLFLVQYTPEPQHAALFLDQNPPTDQVPDGYRIDDRPDEFHHMSRDERTMIGEPLFLRQNPPKGQAPEGAPSDGM